MSSVLLAVVSVLVGVASGLEPPSFLTVGGLRFPLSAALAARGAERQLASAEAAGLPAIPNRSSPTEMLIGTKTSYPFSFPAGGNRSVRGKFVADSVGPHQYSGYSWELFSRFLFPLAQTFGSNFTTFRIVPFANNDEILRAVSLGLVDAGHAAITKTTQREALVDFTTGWFDTGLALMTRTVTGIPVDQAIATISAVGGVLASTIALILAAVLSMSIALFILERAVPGPRPVMRKGCFSGIKDSGVLIMLLLANVQVRIPSGMLSRPVATLCSISSSFLTIVVTAVATVALQSAASSVAITGFSDLSGKTLVMPAATTAAAYVDRNGVGITVTTTQTLDEALERFAAGEGDAMLYDQPILTAFIGTDAAETGRKRFSVVGQVVERQQYGIALNPAFGEDLRKAFDRAILAVYGTNEVAEMRARWLYTDEAATATSAIDSATSSPSSITEFLRDNFVSIAVLPAAPGSGASRPSTSAAAWLATAAWTPPQRPAGRALLQAGPE
ncbi:hypothetical protein FNF29_01470 [Cafeteria roenbergensis]|uniref:Ionotropic glutamate receptor C-terminal domain-containing protein n=1 Tax=Cafeteria roenbergensis TaxID=33653 RepID=A0A5A8CSM2_CAFRO|nr:hypothetical protein FNF29_01470 [Cafeteria roenbergensis]|eukprot:KAA0156053.1 hypothetical protein FNF29_01470 [Cafeteria roenbergensis]